MTSIRRWRPLHRRWIRSSEAAARIRRMMLPGLTGNTGNTENHGAQGHTAACMHRLVQALNVDER